MLRLVLTLIAFGRSARPAIDPDRAFYDHLLAALDSVHDHRAFPQGRCIPLAPNYRRLCDALLLEREFELTHDHQSGRQAEANLERAVAELPRFAVAWYGLGAVRLALAHDTLFSRGGALMPQGTSYLAGAAAAYVQAVTLDTTFDRAIAQLVRLPTGRGAEQVDAERLRLLRRVVSRVEPVDWLTLATLERSVGSRDSAVALERRAMATNAADSGLVALALARDLYFLDQPREARSILLQGAATPTRTAAGAYRAELALVATPAELQAWDTVPPQHRSAWLAGFWQRRDIAEGRKDGARLVEHYRRLEYALKAFAITVPQTGRQRFVSYSEKFQPARCQDGPSVYEMMDRSIGSHANHRDYTPVQDLMDDRGEVWVRHGPPDHRWTSLVTEAAEVWRYNLSPTPLVVQFHEIDFDGIVGASALVSTLVTMPSKTRRQLCVADASLCVPEDDYAVTAPTKASTLCTKEPSEPIKPEIIRRDHDSGMVQIARATQTDSYHRQFKLGLQPSVQIVGLSRLDISISQIVVAYALPVDQMASDQQGNARVYSVDLQLMASDANGRRIDLDTTRQITLPLEVQQGSFATGIATVTVPAGRYHVSAVLTQPQGAGAVAGIDDVEVPSDSRTLTMSGLVIGIASGVRWSSGSSDVRFNPIDVFRRSEEAELYFQQFGLMVDSTYRLRITMFKGAESRNPAVTLTGSFTAQARSMEIARSVKLSELDPGRYRVEAEVSGAGSTSRRAVWLTIVP